VKVKQHNGEPYRADEWKQYLKGKSLSQTIRTLITLSLTVKSYTPEAVKKAQGTKESSDFSLNFLG
jgi:hypothetical protein